MTSEETPISVNEALANTDKSLRRLLRYLRDTVPEPDERLDKEMRVARRQVRANDALIDR